MLRLISRACLALLASLALPALVGAQRADSTERVVKLAPIGVTATRWDAAVAKTAAPLLVIDSSAIRTELPNGVGDLFRSLPGVDATGVGANQVRLMIRGQRGQRILLAEDGMRVNNARRQQDFGELSAITDVNALERVEILRGPASVLYGTDAIGGVVNQLTLGAPALGRDQIGGTAVFRHNSADAQAATHLRVDGRDGRFGFLVAVSQRATTAYQAPAGTFGALTLTRPTLVNDAGVRDGNVTAQLAYDAAPGERLTLKVSRYDATEAGFGYVDPRAWGDSSGGRVRLLYPDQRVDRVTASWSHRPAGGRLADRLTVTASASQNTRTFRQEVDIALAPTASLSVRSRNVTDIHGIGVRAEFIKALNAVTLLTYGADWYRDRSLNTDSSLTRVVGFGPTTTRTSLVANVPNATFGTGGVFAQAQVTVSPRLVLGVGTRGQWIDAVTDRTAGLPANRSGVRASDRALVGQASAQYALRPGVSLVATTGRAFRAPNLVERYFDGPTSEGNGYQVASPDLTPETSVNVDVGLKVRRPRVLFEVTVFDNAIRDGIRIVPLGTSINRLPAYANENIDRLRDRGVEALGEVQLGRGFSALASLTTLRSDNLLSNNPVGDSYAGKIGAELGWRSISGRLGARYEVRHQRRREDITLVGSPVGDALPAFTVHGVRGDAQLPTVGGVRPSLYIAISNLTNALYAEASNTAFFRPEPPRSLLAALRIDF